MRPLYIFDLDGTLANCEHRLHYIQQESKDWGGFFAAADRDKPIWPIINTLWALERGKAEIWIWTGRSDVCRDVTENWLIHYCGMGREILTMRRKSDHRPDDVLKAEWLSRMDAKDLARLVGVFEDRDRVVKMWRDAGVTCFQVANGEF